MKGFENDADMKIVGDERPAAIDTAAKRHAATLTAHIAWARCWRSSS